jgi:beta-galactosidase
MVNNESEIIITGKNTEIRFHKGTCSFHKVIMMDKEIFVGGNDNFYRPVTGIDEGTGDPGRNYASEWKEAGLDNPRIKVLKIETAMADKQAFIYTEVSYNDDKIRVLTKYIIGSKGIKLDKSIINNYTMMTIPRIGVSFILPEEKKYITWYGKGPWENYSDRKEAAQIGLYHSTVTEQYIPYIKPVECGGKEDVRYLHVLDDMGKGICVTGGVPYHFDIHDYSIKECDKAAYTDEISKDGKVYLNLDYLHAGLGGDNGWTKNIHNEYCIGKGYYYYQFTIVVI